jgi:hypothetical protein
MNTELEHQVAWLTAVENIRKVIGIYARAGDDTNNPKVMASIMTADAHWECEGFGSFDGRDTITHELAKVGQERILWSLHFPVSPIIDVADDLNSAHAFWWLWELTTMRAGDDKEENNWLGATYDCDFAREADGWKIKHMTLNIKKVVPYEDAPSAAV